MTAKVIEPASVNLQLVSNKLGEDFILSDAKIALALRGSLDELVRAIGQQDTQS